MNERERLIQFNWDQTLQRLAQVEQVARELLALLRKEHGDIFSKRCDKCDLIVRATVLLG